MNVYSDEYFMRIALKQAQIAFENEEVPVGAVITYQGKVIAKGHNLCEKLTDFTAHAEMQVLTSASIYLQNKYLNECTLYVTLEPCIMCAGAAFWTRIGRIVFGSNDERRGYQRVNEPILHPKTTVCKGILKEECSKIMIDFFKQKR